MNKGLFKEEIPFLSEVIKDPRQELTLEEHVIERKKKLQDKKIQIAALASAILSDPESHVSGFKCM